MILGMLIAATNIFRINVFPLNTNLDNTYAAGHASKITETPDITV